MRAKASIKIAFYVMVLIITSKILGFFREMTIANNFGAGMESDAFFVALMIPDLLFAAIAQAIGTTFIPIYLRTDTNKRNNFMNNLLTIIGILTMFVTLITIYLAPYIVKFFAYGFSAEGYELTVKLSRILLLIMLFLAFNFIAMAKLQSNDRFLIPAAIGIPYNLIATGYLLLVSNKYGIEGYAWIIVFANLFQSLYLMPSLFKIGWRYKYVFDWKDARVQMVLRLSFPVIIGTTVAQINVVIDRMLASSLAEGSISALHYASMVNLLSYGIIVVGITSVIYPKLSSYAVEMDFDKLKKLTLTGIEALIIILIPIVFGGIILANPLISLLFEHGDFNETDRAMTSIAFIFYSLGLLGMGVRELLNRVYYSLQDTKTPMKNGVIALTINVVLNLILIRFLAHGGLALATSISISLAAILLFWDLNKKLGSIPKKELFVTLSKAIFAASVMAVVVYSLYYLPIRTETTLFSLLWLVAAILVGAVTYFLASLIIKQALITNFFSIYIKKAKNTSDGRRV